MSATTDEAALVEIQRSDDLACQCPDDSLLVEWVRTGLANKNSGITVRIVDAAEMQQANFQWRGQDKPTNVLSFPAEFPPEAGVSYLGDILVCAEILERESTAQGKELNDHWAHILVHGVLHLQGYDHGNDHDALQMEQREKELLATLGVADPYRTYPNPTGPNPIGPGRIDD